MAYLYGKTDEKHVKLDQDITKKVPKALDTFKFKLNPLLEGKSKRGKGEIGIRFRASPDTLAQLCSTIVDTIPLPSVFQWTSLEVADWIKKLGFPQYQNTFKQNCINGKNLIRLDASYLVKINITNFCHIKTITNAIRELYGVEKSSFSRSVSKPDRTPNALYKHFCTRTGYKYDKTVLTDLCKSWNILRPHPPYETHWQTLERWVINHRPLKTELIGSTIRKRYNIFTLVKGKQMPLVQKKVYQDCYAMPPCISDWTKEKDLREPWVLSCLKKKTEDKNRVSQERQCIELGTNDDCCWRRFQNQRRITVLKIHVPHKYADQNQMLYDQNPKVRISTNNSFIVSNNNVI